MGRCSDRLGAGRCRWGLLLLWVLLCPFGSVSSAGQVVLLYTGNTRSFLEVCGCTGGQLGGVARRAAALRNLRRAYPDALLLDAGRLFDGAADLDRLRCAVHLAAMARMGYDAANAGGNEFRFGRHAFESMRDTAGVPFVSTNLVDGKDKTPVAPPFQIVERGGMKIGIVGVTDGRMATDSSATEAGAGALRKVGDVRVLPAAEALAKVLPGLRRRVDFVVVLSDLPAEENRKLVGQAAGIGVVVSSMSVRPVEAVGSGLILGTVPQGKAVGTAVLEVEGGRVKEQRVEPIYMDEKMGEDPAVSRMVTDFYAQVAADPALRETKRPRLTGFPAEQAALRGENGFAGDGACRACHLEAYRDWKGSPHAGAYRTLLRVQKHYLPDCVTCHTTGFGFPSGFRIGDRRAHLEGVQCETCHGPGERHVRRPERGNIRGKVAVAVCMDCHTPEQTPEFGARAAVMRAAVDHTGTRDGMQGPGAGLEAAVGDAGGRTRVELFVMALCPFGMQAEAALAPVVKRFGKQIDFRIYFIADEAGAAPQAAAEAAGRRNASCQGRPAEGTGPFRSLHGDAEVEEGVRQAVMMVLYPDRYYDYILLRNRDIHSGNWQAAAKAVGMDPARVAAVAGGPEGEAIFRRNIRRANLMGIDASPTLLVNGVEIGAFVDSMAFARRICQSDSTLAACREVPACGSDRDCSRPGKVGICIDPDRATARCRFTDPVAFDMTVLNDSTCAVCDTGYFIRATRELFPGVRVQTVDAGAPEGRALAVRYGIDRVPAFILDRAFARTVRFERFARTVRHVAGDYLPDPNMVPVSQWLNREAIPGRVDLFVTLESPLARRAAEGVLLWLKEVEAVDRLWVHFPGKAAGEVEAALHLCVREIAPDRYLDYLLCRVRGGADGREGAWPDVCAKRAGLGLEPILRCAKGREGGRLLEAERRISTGFGIPPEMAPVAVLNNRILVTAGMMERLRDVFYRVNPALAGRDRGVLQGKGP